MFLGKITFTRQPGARRERAIGDLSRDGVGNLLVDVANLHEPRP